MTIKQVTEQSKMELREVYKELDIPKRVPKEAKMKEIKNIARSMILKK